MGDGPRNTIAGLSAALLGDQTGTLLFGRTSTIRSGESDCLRRELARLGGLDN